MSENLADVTDNMDFHIEAVIAHLNEKFPQAGPERVREIVPRVFAELEAEAAVPDHLPALSQHRAQERLVAEVGHLETGSAGPEAEATRPFSPERQPLRRIADGEPGALIGRQALTYMS